MRKSLVFYFHYFLSMNKLYIKNDYILHSSNDIKIISSIDFFDWIYYITNQTDHDDYYYCRCSLCDRCIEKKENNCKQIALFLNEYKIEKVYKWNNSKASFEEEDKEHIMSYVF